ncbi:MAG: HNH endonuclease [Kiritimatiellae bacterium]|nr:HNH endonuclease [Kiritimatiellia bacterium]MBR1837475.1 HNH endonuclease [Kiritimatiellia bacterium]
MNAWVETSAPPEFVRRQREKARALRQSAWWRAKLDAGICHYCGRKVPASELTMDHVVPVARGGTSTPGNVVPCCRACNASKGCLTQAERILDELGLS